MIVFKSNPQEGKRMLHQRLTISRVYVTLSMLFSTLAMLFEPYSHQGRSTILSSVPSTWVYSLLILCIISIIDIIINDIIEDKYSLPISKDYRHIIYMLMSLMTISISMGIVTTIGMSFLLIRIWLDAFIAAIVAFLDILGRYRNNRG